MARKRDPKRDEAFEIWKRHNGEITNRKLAEQLGVPEKTISAWKSRDKWNSYLQSNDCSTTKKKRSTTKKEPAKKSRSPSKKEQPNEAVESLVESDELTDKQRFFCLYYLKYFNATKAYQKAYGCSYNTAMVEGHKHLRKPKIFLEIARVKEERAEGILLDAQSVLQKYIDIAFADITDYATFGKKEIPVIGAFGPIKDEEGNQLTQKVNYVDFNESTTVDGTIITEVKQGRNGISVKLADKMKALEMLAKYTDLLSENDRKKLQEEKLKVDIAKAKAEAEKINGDRNDESFTVVVKSKRKGDS